MSLQQELDGIGKHPLNVNQTSLAHPLDHPIRLTLVRPGSWGPEALQIAAGSGVIWSQESPMVFISFHLVSRKAS